MTDIAMGICKSKPFIIVKSDEALGWGSVSHPYIARVSTNRIMLTYFYNGDPPGRPKAGADWPAYSDDFGMNWSFGNPYQWTEDTETNKLGPLSRKKGETVSITGFSYGYCFGVVQHTGGYWAAHLWQPKKEKPGVYKVTGIYSTNSGETYKNREVVYYTPTNWWSPCLMISPVGCILTPGSSITVGYVNNIDYTNTLSSEAFLSHDNGATYHHLSTIANYADATWGNHGPAEPGIVLTKNEELVCLIRTGSDGFSLSKSTAMLLAKSCDYGRSWEHKRMHIPGVMPSIIELQNGVLVATFGRPGNSLIFSIDEGRTWGNEVCITPPDIKTSGYLDIMEISPNRLLVVYDAYNTTTEKIWLWDPPEPVNALWGMYIDVKRNF